MNRFLITILLIFLLLEAIDALQLLAGSQSSAKKVWDRFRHSSAVHPVDESIKRIVNVQGMPFVISKPLGQGHYAHVFEGYIESAPSTPMVLKYFKLTDPVSQSHYKNEVDVLSLIGKLYLRDDRNLRIVQERVAGTSINTLLQDSKYATPYKIRKLKAAYSKAIDDFHKRTGLLHGDLRPGNAMYVKGRAELIDFGMAEKLPDGLSPKQRQKLFDDDKKDGLLNFDKYLMLLPQPGKPGGSSPLSRPH